MQEIIGKVSNFNNRKEKNVDVKSPSVVVLLVRLCERWDRSEANDRQSKLGRGPFFERTQTDLANLIIEIGIDLSQKLQGHLIQAS